MKEKGTIARISALKRLAAVTGLGLLSLQGCAPSPREDFRQSDYRWEILIQLDRPQFYPVALKIYTNTQPKIILTNSGKTHLTAENAVCPLSQNITNNINKSELQNQGCPLSDIMMGRYETVTDQKVTVIDRQVIR